MDDSNDGPNAPRNWRVLRSVAQRISGSRGHAVASATLAVGYVMQLGFQMGYFLLLTRMLGVDTFGQIAAALAAINLVSPLAGIGYGEVALVRVSQDRNQSGFWAVNSTFVTGLMGIGVAFALAAASAFFASEQWLAWPLILGLALSELVLVRSCHVLARVHQARREVARTSAINVSIAAIKMLTVAGLMVSGIHSIAWLTILLNIFTGITFLFFFVSSLRITGYSRIKLTQLRGDLKLAGSFAAGVVSKAVYTDLDKVLLAKWASPTVVGTYAAGYKILSLSFMPIRAILEATFPQQVELANKGMRDCNVFTTKLLALNLLIGSVIAAALFLLAPYVPLLLGDEFVDSIGVLQLGFLLPVLQASHYTLGNHLTAVGYQSVRTFMQIIILATYVVAGIILIPLYSWKGAIGTSLGCELLLAVLFLVSSIWIARKRISS